MNSNLRKTLKIIIAGALVLLCAIAGFYVTASVIIKPDIYGQMLSGTIRAYTATEASIDKVSASVFPTPKIFLSGVRVGGADSPKLEAQVIEINLIPASIIYGKPQIDKIILHSPSLFISRKLSTNSSRNEDGINWGWLNSSMLGILDTKSWASNLPIVINGGSVEYKYQADEKNLVIDNINAAGRLGDKFSLRGTGGVLSRKIGFAIDNQTSRENSSLNAGGVPLNIQLAADDKNLINVYSILDKTPSGNLKAIGKIHASATDIEQWLPSPTRNNNNVKQKKTDIGNKTALPLIVSGDFILADGDLSLSSLDIDGLNSKGKGNADIYWKHWYPSIVTNLEFSTLDYPSWKQILSQRLGEIRIDNKATSIGVSNYDFRKANPVPQNIEIKAKVQAQKVTDGEQTWGKSSISANLEDGILTIDGCDIELAGGGLASLFGVLSQSGVGGLHFQGNLEAKGRSLKQAMFMFNNQTSDFPDIGMGEFTANGNIYVASNQINFSEAKAKINGVDVSGEIISHLDEPHIEAKLKIKNLNFDGIRDSIRKKNSGIINKTINTLANNGAKSVADYGLGFDWLRNLKTKIDAQIVADGFTFMEKSGSRANFGISAYDGVLKIMDAQLVYPDYNTNISLTLSTAGAKPAVALTMNTDQVNTAYFSINPEKAKNESRAKEYMSFGILDSFNGTFDIGIRKLVHDNIIVENVKMQANLDAQQLAIKRLMFIYSKAQGELNGTLYGGKIPGIAVRFTLANADMQELIKALTGISNISGNANISGALATSGHSLGEWLTQMEAKFLVASRSLKMDKINLSAISNVVSASRSSADVVTNVSNALSSGSSEFAVDGSINISGGEMKTPFISLKSGLVEGKLVGGINLSSMQTQLSAIFNFVNLLPNAPPSLIVQLSGAVTKPEIKLDTSSLEAFVAKRSIK